MPSPFQIIEYLSYCLFVKNLTNSKTYMYGFFYNDIEPDAPIQYIYITITADRMIVTVRPDDFESYCKKKRESNDTINSRFEYFNQLSQNINPILVINILK